MQLFRLLYESFRQAWQQLFANRLRSLLSILGISIGIWCVITIFSAVDSLEASIRDSFQELGDDVVYINTMPWDKDPREDFWKYMRRPQPSLQDFRAIKSSANGVDLAAINLFIGRGNLEYQASVAERVNVIGVTYDYGELFNLDFAKGRFFTVSEVKAGANLVILGHEAAKALFLPGEDPINKEVKVKGHKLRVVGVLEREGQDLLNPINFDEVGIIPFGTARKYVNITNRQRSRGGSSIAVKAKEEVGLEQLKDELTGVLRASRYLKPKEENNFELNSLSLLANIFDEVFGAIRIGGVFIGLFSIIVGIFSVANIMFVSVKERTKIIGIKKAIGAKYFAILLEFLIESILLCLVGGVIGLFFVYAATEALSTLFDFDIFLSYQNVLLGVGISTFAGVLAGIIPAHSAAKLVPVEAIRS